MIESNTATSQANINITLAVIVTIQTGLDHKVVVCVCHDMPLTDKM